MINSFRKRLIAINIMLASIILLTSMAVVFSVSYGRIESEMHYHLRLAIQWVESQDNGGEYKDEVSNYKVYTVVDSSRDLDGVVVIEQPKNKPNTYIMHYAVPLTDQNINDLIELHNDILSNKYNSTVMGRFGSAVTETTLSSRYTAVMVNKNNGNGIATLMLYGGGASLLGVLCFFMLSIFIAKVSLSPLEKSWNQQRQFVADASHELKTPLSVIMANTEIIASNADCTVASQMKWIENTRAESKRMSQLITNLLMLAKSDGGLKTNLEQTNLSDITRTIALMHDSLFYENNKQFKSVIDGEAIVNGNKQQLEQLVTILLDNANKYSLDNGTIDMRLGVIGRQATLIVSNDSAPITNEQLKHLFDRFYTIDNARNRQDSGNGLGLSIAQMIVNTHDGKIAVTHENGRTTFTVTLPLMRTNGKETK